MRFRNEIFLDQCFELLRHVKYVSEQWEWVEAARESGELRATSSLLDAELTILQGIKLYGRYKRRPATGFEEFHLGVSSTIPVKGDVFRLDVQPENERSHTDPVNGEFYGPHCHWGDKRVSFNEHIVTNVRCDWYIDNLEAWIAKFKRAATLHANHSYDLSVPEESKVRPLI